MTEASQSAWGAPEVEGLGSLLRVLDLVHLIAPTEVADVAPAHVAGLAGARVSAGLATIARRLGYALAGALTRPDDGSAGEALTRERAAADTSLERVFDGVVGRGPIEIPGLADTASDELATAVATVVRQRIDALARRRVAPDHPRWADAAALLREGAAAEHGSELVLAWDRREKRPAGVHADLSPPERAIVLAECALEYTEAWVAADPLLALERRASAWFFSRWSLPRGTAASTRERREQEWALLERGSLVLEGSMVEGFIASGSTDDLAAGVRTALVSLARCRMGAFEVAARPRADRCELVDALTGDRYSVHEHNAGLRYDPGWTGLGRLFPLEELEESGAGALHALRDDDVELWVRSPGMAFFESDSIRGRDLAETLAEGRLRGVSPGILAEGLFSTLGSGAAKVPREVPAAGGRAEARVLWEQADEELLRAGLAEDLSGEELLAEDVPAGLREAVEANGASRHLRGYRLDEVVGDWVVALGEQMHGRRPPATARAGRRRAKSKAKRPKGPKRQ